MKSGSLPSVQSKALHTFSRSPQANIPRSTFSRTHGHKTTFNEGYLVPVFVDEVLPGDTFNLSMTAFARLATPIFPIMDNMYMESFFFFVPNRLIWDNWQRFNGEQTDPGDSTDYLIPQISAPAVGGWTENSLADYFGLPTKINSLTHSTLWFRAYNLIWNEWFRDENLQNSVNVPKGDGPDVAADFTLLRRGKRYDYFTSCLPFPQKGPAVDLPLGTTAPVLRVNNAPNAWFSMTPGTNTATNISSPGAVNIQGNANPQPGRLYPVGASTSPGVNFDPNGSLYADLSSVASVTINSLRQAFQTQRLYERDARGGTRYTEIIRSHFGVISPDARLQRPEYLGGGSSPVMISPIAQTSSTDGTSPQGNLAAIGTCSLMNHGFTKSFTEHGVIIGMVSTRADLNYQQGLNRMWSRRTRFDFYWPALSHIGEQAVLNKEIYAQGTSADDDVFGYQERYAEYRYKPSIISGLFRTNATGTLDSWHLAQDFASLPVLNSAFIQENAPMARIKAVSAQPDFIFDSNIRLNCARPMPVYSVPGLVDHF